MANLSIVVPVYITPKNTMFGPTVEFLSNLLFKTKGIGEHEIVLVNDGSDDKYMQIIKKRFGRLKIISNATNMGFAKAINNGVNNCIGEKILLLNNDIEILESGWLVNLLNGMEHFGADIVAPKQSMLDKDYEYIPDAKRSYYKSKKCFCYPVGWCLLINKKVFRDVGLLPINFGIGFWEDTAWIYTVINKYPQFSIHIIDGIDKVQIRHKEHQTFKSLGIDINSQYIKNRDIFIKGITGKILFEMPKLDK